jgi:hypothetical protein
MSSPTSSQIDSAPCVERGGDGFDLLGVPAREVGGAHEFIPVGGKASRIRQGGPSSVRRLRCHAVTTGHLLKGPG